MGLAKLATLRTLMHRELASVHLLSASLHLRIMDETDAFFTHTIVGAPFSVLMGRRLKAEEMVAQGMEVDMKAGTHRLSDSWHDWWVMSHAGDLPGRPRPRPGRLRLWLERHALWLALLGLTLSLSSGVLWMARP